MPTAPTERRTAPLPVAALCSAAVLLALAAIVGRDLWFFSDDWNIYADYHAGNLLTPFNGHLSLVPAGIYQALFHTFGMGSYIPYRVCGLVALAVLAFQIVRATSVRFGDLRQGRLPWGAVLVALAVSAVMWNSAGKMNLLFPFLMNFTIPIAALIAIWWHLDRTVSDGRRALHHEVAASCWLVLALATSGLGLMTMAAVGVELALSRAPWRRWAVLAPGPILWALWYLGHRDANDISTDVAAIAAYSARMFLGATTSVAAGSEPLGILLALALVAYLGVAAARWRSLDARTLGALAAPVTFVAFTAITRLDIVPAIPPDELRYSWAVAAYLVLAVVVAARRRPMFEWAVPTAVWVAAAVGAVVVLGVGAVRLERSMQDWNEQVATARPGLSTVLFATEAIGSERIDPDVVIPLSYVPVTTGGYLSAVADVGSPIADATAADLGGALLNREVADRLLVEQLDLHVVGAADERCADGVLLRADADSAVEVAPGSDVVVRDLSGATVRLARFAPLSSAIELATPDDAVGRLVVPSDAPAVADMPGVAQEYPYRLLLPPGASALRCP